MDPFSLAVGFVVGAITGAAGHYLGEKYTDQRRSKEAVSKSDQEWAEIERRFPKIIAEMREDIKRPNLTNVREFFIKSSRTKLKRSDCFEYHTDVHTDLSAAIAHLADLGYIVDITPGSCPMYRMKEHFVDRLRTTAQ